MTKTPSEGVIKFQYNLKRESVLQTNDYIGIEKWRSRLFKMNLIGECPTERVGFGNLSCRSNENNSSFIITGTQTGKHPELDETQYTKITWCDLDTMKVEALGLCAPSSESLTHFSIYNYCPAINFVFHIHNQELWEFMLINNFDSTAKEVDYGTKAMALEVKGLIQDKTVGIFAMAGHEDGIIAYGKNAKETGEIILETLKQSKA